MTKKNSFDLKQLAQLVPEALRSKLWVAGGYLADPSKACDIDVWLLLGDTRDGSEGTMAQLHAYATKHWWHLEPLERATLIAPHPEAGFDEEAEEYSDSLKEKGIYYVGKIQLSKWPLPAQLFATPYTTPEELLVDFDVSTHQLAQNVETGERVVVASTTPVTVVPRITNWTTPATTVARIERLAKRYGFVLENIADYATLKRHVANPARLAT